MQQWFLEELQNVAAPDFSTQLEETETESAISTGVATLRPQLLARLGERTKTNLEAEAIVPLVLMASGLSGGQRWGQQLLEILFGEQLPSIFEEVATSSELRPESVGVLMTSLASHVVEILARHFQGAPTGEKIRLVLHDETAQSASETVPVDGPPATLPIPLVSPSATTISPTFTPLVPEIVREPIVREPIVREPIVREPIVAAPTANSIAVPIVASVETPSVPLPPATLPIPSTPFLPPNSSVLPTPRTSDEWIAVLVAFGALGSLLFFNMHGCGKAETDVNVADASKRVAQAAPPVIPLIPGVALNTPAPIATPSSEISENSDTEDAASPASSPTPAVAVAAALVPVVVTASASPVVVATPAVVTSPSPTASPEVIASIAPTSAPTSAPSAPTSVPSATPAATPSPAPTVSKTDNISDKLAAFLKDKNQPVDKKTWFGFDNQFFDTGRSVLRPESKPQIESVAAILKAHPEVRVKIGGYTDNVGDQNDNQSLSERRARAVRTALIAYGISSSRIEAEGYGENHPVATNDSDAGRQQNRRTALRVLKK